MLIGIPDEIIIPHVFMTIMGGSEMTFNLGYGSCKEFVDIDKNNITKGLDVIYDYTNSIWYVVGTENLLFYSTDGKNWTLIFTKNTYISIALKN
jgi:hypothetical protein